MPTTLTRRDFLTASAAAAAFLASRPAFAQTSDPTALSIAEAQRLVRRRDLSPLDLVEAYLARIRRLDGRLNAFVTVTEERAVERARALASELAAGRWRGPLHGIPIALKDKHRYRRGADDGRRARCSRTASPDEDAEVVDAARGGGRRRPRQAQHARVRLWRDIGDYPYRSRAQSMGRGSHRGRVVRRLGRGGRGAVVRRGPRHRYGRVGPHPAAHCGIVGLKPTYGLASIRGIVPLSVSLDHVGPMCGRSPTPR